MPSGIFSGPGVASSLTGTTEARAGERADDVAFPVFESTCMEELRHSFTGLLESAIELIMMNGDIRRVNRLPHKDGVVVKCGELLVAG